MDLSLLFQNHADYHRKKWFPSIHPDPLGPFADAVTEDTLQELESYLKTKPDPQAAALAGTIMAMLPTMQHPALVKEANRFLANRIQGVPARFLLYYFRSLPAEQRHTLEDEAKRWAQESGTPLSEWLQVRTGAERKHDSLLHETWKSFGVDYDSTLLEIETTLRGTRDQFDWELRQLGSRTSLAEFLALFRIEHADTFADWNDFPALSRNWSEVLQFRNMPRLDPSPEDPAVQYTFPIDPPSRVRIHYGKGAGPMDAHRFIRELGRGVFYTDMSQDLPEQKRLLGDPSLPEFWAELYGTVLQRRAGFSRLVRPGSEDLAGLIQKAVQFRIRHEAVLALCRARVDSSLKDAQDLYVASWETVFAFEAPRHLYLFDLERSDNSLATVLAYRAAAGVEERLRTLYGNDWFASERCASQLRGYRDAGFTLRVTDILADLGATPATDLL